MERRGGLPGRRSIIAVRTIRTIRGIEFIRRQTLQCFDGAARDNVVVHALFLASFPVRQVHDVDLRSASLQERHQFLQGGLDVGLGHYVRVEDDVDQSPMELYVLPFG